MASYLALKRLLSRPIHPTATAASNPLRRLSSAPEKSQNSDGPLSRKDEVYKAPVVVLFHASGLTSNQWRKLKNLWHPGKTLFRPPGGEKAKKRTAFFDQVDRSVGPTSVLYLPEESAAEKLALLPTEESAGQDMLLLYGQYQNTLVDHVDIAKVSEFDEAEASLFGFYLPTSYLCAVLDPVFADDEADKPPSPAAAAEAEAAKA